jgi:3-hydroxyisobutyrate dehydrogenase
MRVGFIGLGNMGRPMAHRLLAAGWDLTVYNRTAAKAAPLIEAGARASGTIADLRECDVVISMVGTDDDLRSIALGPDGLFGEPDNDVLLVDCSTVSAEVTEEVAAAARSAGGDVLAAPVAGGPSVIPRGHLAIVCSGARASYQRAEPVLESLAHKVLYVGDGALARHVKILHNLIVAVIAHAVAEVSMLGEAVGVARADLLEFVCAGAIGSPFIRYKSEQMKSLDFTAAFTTSLMVKDIELGRALAGDRVDIPLVDHTRATLADAVAAGLGEKDIAVLVAFLADRNGITLEPQ